jgi:amino acid adenylation domain-containing protein
MNSQITNSTEHHLWRLQQLDVKNPSYNVPIAIDFTGNVDCRILVDAVKKVVQSNAILNVRYVFQDSKLTRIGNEGAEPKIVSLTAGDANSRVAFRKIIDTAIDLSRGVMGDVAILSEGNNAKSLAVTIHHIVCDELSAAYIFQDIVDTYRVMTGAANEVQTRLRTNYDVYLDNKKAKGDLGAVLTDSEHHQISHLFERQSDPGALVQSVRQFETAEVRSFRLIAESLDCDLRTLFLSLAATLIADEFNRSTFAILCPVDDRPVYGFGDGIGFPGEISLNAFEIDSSTPFTQVVAQAQLASCLPGQPERAGRSLTGTAYDVSFDYVDLPECTLEGNGFTASLNLASSTTPKYPLAFIVRKVGKTLTLTLEAGSNYFESAVLATLMERLNDRLVSLLNSSAPGAGGASLPTMPRVDERFLAPYINPTREGQDYTFVEFGDSDTLLSAFQRTVKEHGQRTAISFHGASITYEELNARSRSIARYLCAHFDFSVQRNVALCFDHGPDMISAMLAVLYVGSAYVPLDNRFPEERLRHIVQHSEAVATLTDEANVALARSISPHRLVLDVTAIVASSDRDGDEGATHQLSPSDRAYILYTSGSTGTPKGVVQTHKNVLAHVAIWANNLKIGAGDNVSLISSFAWDSAVQDIYSALLVGAKLFPFSIHNSGINGLIDFVNLNGISAYHSTVPIFRALIRAVGAKGLPSLRVVAIGGDLIFQKDVEQLGKVLSADCVLMNAYGATESSSGLCNFLRAEETINRGIVALGTTAPGVEVILVNDGFEVRRPNEIGEICILSEFVAPTYWRGSECASEILLQQPPKRLRGYKTGDLGRLLPSRKIEHVGRVDFQMKIRGNRVELGEVEAELQRCVGIRDAVVAAKMNDDGERELIAYYVVDGSVAIDQRQLRSTLSKMLPEFMIPRYFVPLERIPLTPNGKIDRLSLPVPDPKLYREFSALSDPATPWDSVESFLLQQWRRLLEDDQLQPDDDFFDVGGHSLLALEMFTEIESEFGVDIPPVVLYEGISTVSRLAEKIRSSLALKNS